MFLIEGCWKAAAQTLGPRINKESDSDGPDIMQSSQDFMNLMCSIIARNYPGHEVKLLQTDNESHTVILLSAITILLQSYNETNRLAPSDNSELFHSRVMKWGGSKRGTESELRALLLGHGVPEEAIQRVIRRYGDAHGLRDAYKKCLSEVHRQLLLSDLGIGGTNPRCSSAVGPNDNCEDQDETVTLNAQMTAHSQAIYDVIQVKGNREMDSGGRTKIYRTSKRNSFVLMSPAMSCILKQLDGFDDSILGETYESPDETLNTISWANIMVCSPHRTLNRKSQKLLVVVINGMDLVECLIQAVSSKSLYSTTGKISEETCVQIVQIAIQELKRRFHIEKLSTLGNSNDTVPVHIVIILENLVSSVHGAIGKLKSAISKARSTQCNPSISHNHINDQHFRLSEDRLLLSLAAGQLVEVNALPLIYLSIAFLTLNNRYQCLLSQSSVNSFEFLCSIINVYHKEALLLF